MFLYALLWRCLPFLIIVLAFLAAKYALFASIDADLVRNSPYILAVLVILYAGMFNRMRFLAPVLIALFSYHFIRERLQIPLAQPSVLALFIGLNMVFCAQLVVSSILPEKGMFNRFGYTLIILFGLMDAVLWYYGASFFWMKGLQDVAEYQNVLLEKQFWVTELFVWMHALTLVVLLIFVLYRRTAGDVALLLTWFCGVLVFSDFALLDISAISFSALFIGLFILYQQSNYQVTYKDALTCIPGRRALEDYLATLGKRYSIAMLDVDHFKKFNDTHGHDVGDQVLKMVASQIAKVQGGGKAFRYGGEEFTIVFNRKTADEAFLYLEVVRESIQHYQMVLRSQQRTSDKKTGKAARGQKAKQKANSVSVTISIGVANSAPGLSPKDVIKAADELLYVAKEQGRNCSIRPDSSTKKTA